jgi:Arc/MetJ-type ribon-helix-helix transcriptional regulator
MPQKTYFIKIGVSEETYEKVQKLVDKGKYPTKADVVRTALIEWLKEQELKTTYKKEGVRE